MTLAIDLTGKKSLIPGSANNRSIVYGCAQYFEMAGDIHGANARYKRMDWL